MDKDLCKISERRHEIYLSHHGSPNGSSKEYLFVLEQILQISAMMGK